MQAPSGWHEHLTINAGHKQKPAPSTTGRACSGRSRGRLAGLDDLALVVESDGDGRVAGIARLAAPGAVGGARQAAHAGIAVLLDLQARYGLADRGRGIATPAQPIGPPGSARHGRA